MKFYKFTLFILFLLLPAGLVLMWKYKPKWNKVIKFLITLVFSFISLIYFIAIFTNPSNDIDNTNTTESAILEETSETLSNTVDINSEKITENVEESATIVTNESTTIAEPSTTEKSISTTQSITQTASTTAKATTTTTSTTKQVEITTKPSTTKQVTIIQNPESSKTVYVTKSGKKYHYENPCGNGTYYPISLTEAKAKGYTECEKCVLH